MIGILYLSVLVSSVFARFNSSTTTWKDAGSQYSYGVLTPKNYQPSVQTPLLIFLSGSGAKGSFADAPDLATYSGVGKILDDYLQKPTTSTYKDVGAFINSTFIVAFVIAPTSTVHFNPDVIANVRSQIITDYNVRKGQIYLAGYSMGCRGVMRALTTNPTLYSAALCSAGTAESQSSLSSGKYIKQQSAPDTYSRLGLLITTPLQLFYGATDTTNLPADTKATYNAIVAAGGKKVSIREFAGADHSAMSLLPFQDMTVWHGLTAVVNLVRQPARIAKKIS